MLSEQEVRLEFLPSGKRAPEQLRSVSGRPGHIGGAHRQLGPDAHPAADGRADDAARPEPEPEEQDDRRRRRRRRDRQENTQPHVPAEQVGRRTGVADLGQPGHALVRTTRRPGPSVRREKRN